MARSDLHRMIQAEYADAANLVQDAVEDLARASSCLERVGSLESAHPATVGRARYLSDVGRSLADLRDAIEAELREAAS